MFGEPYIERGSEYIEADNEFLGTIDSDFDSRTTAAAKFVHLGFDYFYKLDLRTAMKRFNQAWLIDSENAGSFFGFWLVHNVLDNDSVLSNYFDLASIQHNHDFNAEKYYKLGKDLDKEKYYENLALHYACSSFPEFGKADKALQSCLTLLDLDQKDTLALQNLVYVHREMQEWDKALSVLRQSLQYRKDVAFVYNDIAWTFQEMNKLDSAEANYLKAIGKSEINYFMPRINYCVLMEMVNKCSDAIPVIENCINAIPKEGFFHFMKGRLLLCSNQENEAIKALKKAKKLGSEEAAILLLEIKN
ncbi:hypothetical protein DIT68_02455 [Brumimicrobium oceani]|uniref:Uncharacterized protein n=2 Tax=Brumimicrobium oceani TaxID=2100725 RepID=A0A2U2XH93_9FLAO|nr:hypothetical protein DIT68_02455 [Brumimicrobium oceani]